MRDFDNLTCKSKIKIKGRIFPRYAEAKLHVTTINVDEKSNATFYINDKYFIDRNITLDSLLLGSETDTAISTRIFGFQPPLQRAKDIHYAPVIALYSMVSYSSIYNVDLPLDVNILGFPSYDNSYYDDYVQIRFNKSGTYFYPLNSASHIVHLESLHLEEDPKLTSLIIYEAHLLALKFARTPSEIRDIFDKNFKNKILRLVKKSINTFYFKDNFDEIRDKILDTENKRLLSSTELEKTTSIERKNKVNKAVDELLKPKFHANSLIKKQNQKLVLSNQTLLKESPSVTSEWDNQIQREKSPQVSYNLKVQEIIDDFNSYRKDLIKMMSKPTLADLNNPKVRKFSHLCEDHSLSIEEGQIITRDVYLSFKHEHRLLIDHVDTIQLSNFSKEHQKRLTKANLFLNKALNSESTDNEKEISIKAALKELNTVLPASTQAIESLKVQVGLKELTM